MHLEDHFLLYTAAWAQIEYDVHCHTDARQTLSTTMTGSIIVTTRISQQQIATCRLLSNLTLAHAYVKLCRLSHAFPICALLHLHVSIR